MSNRNNKRLSFNFQLVVTKMSNLRDYKILMGLSCEILHFAMPLICVSAVF